MNLIVGITGASGAIYGLKLLQTLQQLNIFPHIIMTPLGIKVMKYECGVSLAEIEGYGRVYDIDDMFAPPASGSFITTGMAIIPCSMKTVAAISHGLADNLLTRAADVMLKEGRRLVVVPRETPVNTIHLQNMLLLSQAGGRILPAAPGFYHKPQTIDDLANFIVGKVLDLLDIPHQLFTRWGNSGDE